MSAKPATARKEFAPIMAFMSVALGVAVEPARQEAYYGMLCDIDAETLWRAVREIIATREYSSLPMVGEIRKHALAIRLNIAAAPTPVEAWEIVVKLVNKFDVSRDKFEKILAAVADSHLREFLRRFGRGNLYTLAYADDGTWERSRFERAYSAFLEHQTEEQVLALPDSSSTVPRLVQDLAASLTARMSGR